METNSVTVCVPRLFSLGKQGQAPSEHLTISAAKVDSERDRDRERERDWHVMFEPKTDKMGAERQR